MADASLHLSEDLFKKFLREHPKDLILVDFYADWCPHCQTVGPILENVARLYKSKKVWVVKIDTDAYDSLSREYKVDVLPTLILLQEGKQLERAEGSQSQSFFESWLKKHLK